MLAIKTMNENQKALILIMEKMDLVLELMFHLT